MIRYGQQWAGHIYPILLTYNKFAHSATEHMPKEASKQGNHVYVYVNLKLKAKNTHIYTGSQL